MEVEEIEKSLLEKCHWCFGSGSSGSSSWCGYCYGTGEHRYHRLWIERYEGRREGNSWMQQAAINNKKLNLALPWKINEHAQSNRTDT